jgi:hypothetical protein
MAKWTERVFWKEVQMPKKHMKYAQHP